jgi:hypothetical protein
MKEKGVLRSEEILRRMTSINCNVKLKSKKESLQFIKERYEQLKLEGEIQTPEFKMLKKLLGK